jgi:NADPH:quinone reductase-like Zn-dependent oxidoreductase
VFGYISTREEFTHYTEELFRFIQEEKIPVKIHKIYDLRDVQTVHRDLEGRKTMGKLLMRP